MHRGQGLNHISRYKGIGFLLPAMVAVGAVTLYPLLDVSFTSTYQTLFLKRIRFIGLDNYVQYFGDRTAWIQFSRTLTFVGASLGFSLPIGLGLALLLNDTFPLRTVFRTIIVLPWVVSQLVTALLFMWLLNAQYGPINYILQQLSIGSIEFLGDPKSAMLSLVMAAVWQSYPYPMLLILAALQTIPREVEEAAVVDGAAGWVKFRRITFPLISHTVLVCTIIQSIHLFNMVTLPLVLTGGGPINATDVIGLRVYRDAFVHFKMGSSAAGAMYMLMFNLAFSLFYVRVFRRQTR